LNGRFNKRRLANVVAKHATVAQFLAEWFAAVEASLDATTWQNWKDYAHAYVIPRIGEERLQKLNEPQLLNLYSTLLAEGQVKRDRNTEMFRYWSARVANGENPRPLEVSEACGTTIHPARTALRRYESGIVPTALSPGLAPKTVRNVHTMIHPSRTVAHRIRIPSDNGSTAWLRPLGFHGSHSMICGTPTRPAR
jgi:hypothetical protein